MFEVVGFLRFAIRIPKSEFELAAAFADLSTSRQERTTWMVFRKIRISKRRYMKLTEKFS
jgi:hypothetical protein